MYSKEYHRLYRLRNAERIKENQRRYHALHRDRIRERQRKYRSGLRGRVLDILGGKCTCCGETEEVFLAVDHIHNDGGPDRKRGSNYRDYWQRVLGYLRSCVGPVQNRYQILCHNCNYAKYHGGCPHGDR